MAKTAQDVMQLIREQGIKMVDFKMVDINGQYRHVTIPAQNFTEAITPRTSLFTTKTPWRTFSPYHWTRTYI